MKKQFLRTFPLLLLVLLVALLSSCGKDVTVSYVDADGSEIGSITAEAGDTLQRPEDPTKDGYVFSGWSDGTDLWDFENGVIEEDTVLRAVWTPCSYAITYDLAGGALPDNAVSGYTVESESFVLPTPERAGYTFLGWTYEGVTEPQTAVEISKGSLGDRAYTANWLYNTYSLGFDLAGGVAGGEYPSGYGIEGAEIVIADPTRYGYTFAGWSSADSEELITSLVIASGSIGDRSYTAVWVPVTYTITLDLAGGSLDTCPDSYTIESGDIALPAPVRTGYTFLGWLCDGAETPATSVVIESGSSGDRAYTAVFAPVTYGITLELDGGVLSVTAPDSYTIESADIILPVPTKHGYTFLGWTYEGAAAPELNAILASGSFGEKLYTAVWQINTYTITVDLAGGALSVTLPESYTVLDEDIVIPAPTRQGYAFLGWRVDGELLSSLTVDTNAAADFSAVAEWELVGFLITYNGVAGATNANPDAYTTEDPTITLRDPSKTGYIFLGWTYEGVTEPAKGVVIETGSIGNKTFTANWAPRTYSLTINLAGGTLSVTPPTTYTIESDRIVIPDPERAGYEFLGWDAGSGSPFKNLTINTGAYGDKTYTACWRVIEYKIEYELNGGTFDVDFEDCYNVETGTITLPSPNKTGYTFLGWVTDGVDTPTIGLEIAAGSLGNKNFTARWEVIEYKYEISLGNGETVPTRYTVESEDITLPTPTKRGYTFLGWTYEGVTVPQKTVVIKSGSTGDKLFTANWQINQYTISVNLTGGTASDSYPTTYTVESGDITIASPTRSGYTFRGWQVNGSSALVTNPVIKAGSIGNVSYVAQWQLITYTITYEGMEGATHTNPTSYNVTSGDIVLAAPVKLGYTFLGWTDNVYGNTEPSTYAGIPGGFTRDFVFTAHWEINTYDISVDLAGGSLPAGTVLPDSHTVIDEDIVVPDPVKENYVFLGWCVNSLPTLEKNLVIDCDRMADVDLVAVWEAEKYTITYEGMDGATHTNPSFYTVESGAITLGAPTKKGYTFLGWTYEGVSEPATSVTIPADASGERSFTANWSLDTYTITFDLAGGSITGTLPTSYTVISADIAIANPEKVGYTFLGWSQNGAAPVLDLVIENGTAGNLAYVAVYQLIEYKIEYELNGGSFTVDFSQSYNKETGTITLPSPEKPGYAFVGWTTDGIDTPTEGLEIAAGSLGDKSFTAHWSIITYTVEISVGDGSYEGTIPTTYTVESEDITLPIPTKFGHTFVGWTWEGMTTPQRVVVLGKGSTGNRLFVANWELTKYPITYKNIGNATYTNPDYYTMEDGTITITAPERYGYTFLGWTYEGVTEPTMTYSFEASEMREIVLTAHWEAYSFAITYYNTKGASNPNPVEYIAGEKVITLASLSASGYTFLGWYDAAGNKVTEIGTDASGAIELTARWNSTAAGTSGLTYTLSSDGTYYIIGAYSGSASTIVIPSTYNGKPVKEIAANAFKQNKYLTTLVISDGIETIGKNAFYYCSKLTTITIGADVKSIGQYAFYECNYVTTINYNAVNCGALGSNNYAFEDVGGSTTGVTVNIGKDVRQIPSELFSPRSNGNYTPRIKTVVFADGSVCESIGYRAFYYAGNLSSINLPASLKSIGSYAFYSGVSLTEINLPASLESIGSYAFSGCTKLTSITIPENVKTLGTYAFQGCTGLTAIYYNAIAADDLSTSYNGVFYNCGAASNSISVVIGNKVERIPVALFYPYSNGSYSPYITSVTFEAGSSCTEIGAYAFAYLYKLGSIELPASVKKIDEYAFYYCSGLASVSLGGTEEIARYAFYNCSNLASLSFSADLKTIGQNAFNSCSKITSVSVPSLGVWCGIGFADSSANPLTRGGVTLYVGGVALEDLVIPSGVTSIGSYAFYGLKIKTLTIPASVTEIGAYAFANCTELTTVKLPGVVTLGNYAFSSCTKLEGVEMPVVVTIGQNAFQSCAALTDVDFGTKLESIGQTAFSSCTALSEVDFPSTLTSIGSYAFSGCTALGGITLPSSLTTVGSQAFYNCSGLSAVYVTDIGAYCGISFADSYTPLYYAQKLYVNGQLLKNLVVPDGVEAIGAYAFNNYVLLESVVLSDTVKTIGNCAFQGCTALTSVDLGDSLTSIGTQAFRGSGVTSIVIPDTVTTINSSAFYECRALVSVTLGANLTSIGSQAFYGCSALTSIVIPDKVTSIGQQAFESCSALESVSIGKSVRSFGQYAFRYCASLCEVYYNAVSASNISSSYYIFYRAGRGEGNEGITLTIGKDVTSIPAYLFHSTSNQSDRANLVAIEVEDGSVLTSIGNYAFYSMIYLAEVELPEGLTSIGEYAFQECRALTALVLPDSLTTIGKYAFSYCNGLESLTLGSGLATMGDYAFYSCTALKAVSIPGSLKSVPGYAFQSCTSLATVTIGEGVTTLTQYAFNGCKALASVTLPSTLTTIGSYAFQNCSSLVGITLPESLTTLSDYAFKGCTALTSIVIPESVKTLGQYVFSGCTSLKTATLPSILTALPAYLFDGCTALESVAIPAGVTTINKGVFQNCSSLKAIELPAGLTSIGETAFYNCSALTELTLPEGLQTINKSSFSGLTGITALVIPDTVKTISTYAFQNCTALKTLVIGSGVTSLGNYAFSGCTALESIDFNAASLGGFSANNYVFANAGTAGDGVLFTIDKAVTSVPAYLLCPATNTTLEYAMKLRGVVFEEGSACTSIGTCAFAYTVGLKSLALPNGVSIGSNAFIYCRDLESFTIPAGTTSIPNYMFQGCMSLKAIEIPASVTTIGASAFYDCHSLESITIPASVTTIGSQAFYNCYGLTEINLNATALGNLSTSSNAFYNAGKNAGGITLNVGKDVTKLPNYLFYVSGADYAPKITEVVFAEDCACATIGQYAFYNNPYLLTFTIPEGITSIGNYAFQNCTKLFEVENHSALTVTPGATTNGYVANYAKNVYTDASGSKIVNIDGILYYKDAEKGLYYAVGCDDGVTELNFVESIDGNSYSIVAGAFRGRTSIKSVTFSSGITSIGEYAFYGCSGIESITIPSQITVIEKYAFANCSGLTELTIPASVTSIGQYAFFGCSGVTRLVIGQSVSSIGNYAFSGMTGLTEIVVLSDKLPTAFANGNNIFYNAGKNADGITLTFAPHITRVPSYMFNPAGSASTAPRIKEVIFGENSQLTSIGTYAFYCTPIEKLTLPERLVTIEKYAFYDCGYLEELIINSTALADLGSDLRAFEYAGRLGDGLTVTFGKDVTRIPAYLFYATSASYAPNIIAVCFADDAVVTTIGQYAFGYNQKLTSITLPASLTTIADNAFYYCSAITEVHIPTLKDWLEIGFATAMSSPAYYGTLYVGGEVLPAELVIPEGITSIGAYAFYGNKTLTSVVFPAGVESIGSYAFSNIPGLTTVSVNAKRIEAGAFYNCPALSSVTIGKDVEYIGNSAFSAAYLLESITFNAVNCTVGTSSSSSYADVFASAGRDAEGGVTVIIGKDVTCIPAYLFSSGSSTCPNFAAIVFADGSACTAIGDYAFYQCTKLKEITIPAGVKAIGTYAFYNCTGLTEIDLAGVEEVGHGAFIYCYGLESVTAEKLTTIGNSAFASCTALKSFVISDSVTKVGDSAFKGCTALESIAFGKGITSIGTQVLQGTTALTELYYNVASIGAFTSSTAPFYNAGSVGGLVVTIGKDVTAIPDYLFYSSSAPANVTKVVFEDGSACKSIGQNAFRDLTMLTEVIMTDGLESVANGAFYGCTALTSINIPETIKNFGTDVFYNCSGITYNVYGGVNYLGNAENPYLIAVSVADESAITNLVIHPDARIILREAFRYCTGIKSVTIGDKLVTIGARAFENCQGIETLTLGKSVETIGDYAFYRCYALTAVVIPDSTKTIGSYAFYNCTSLTTVTVGKGVIKMDGSFDGCTALTAVYYNATRCSTVSSGTNFSGTMNNATLYIGKNVEYLPPYVFYGSGFTNVVFEDGSVCTEIGAHAFYSSDITAIEIPASVTKIGEYAFAGCYALRSVTMGNAVTAIERYTFIDCTALESIKLSTALTSIGTYAFKNCSALKEITIPNGVTSLPNALFYGCSSLESITLPFVGAALDTEGLSASAMHLGYIFGTSSYSGSVEVYAYDSGSSYYKKFDFYLPATLKSVTVTGGTINGSFEACRMLETIALTGDIGYIAAGSFKSCTNVNTLIYGVTGDIEVAEGALTGITACDVIVKKEVAALPAYIFRGIARSFTFEEGSRLTSIGNYAMADNALVTEIVLPASLTSIGSYAFSGCSSLTVIAIPANVTTIGSYAFSGCSALESITLPDAVTVIADGLFNECLALTTVNLGNVTEIGASAFQSCRSLASITLPASLTTIGSYAFGYCDGLTSITIPAGVTVISDHAFYHADVLTSITLPTGITEIGEYAFYYCSSLASIALPASLTTIGDSAFRYCTALTEITLPASLSTIGAYAFANCTSLTDVVCEGTVLVGNYAFTGCTQLASFAAAGVSGIGDSAFYGCAALTTVDLGNASGKIGDYAFYNCKALTSLTLPEGITSIGSRAFGYVPLSTITVPNSVTTLASYAFAYASCETLVIGSGVTEIPSSLCDQSTIKNVVLSNSVTTIGKSAFYNCSNLVSISFGNALETIGESAFFGCSRLASVTFPETLTTIGQYAFYNCRSISGKIVLPDSLTSIGVGAFQACTSITEVDTGSGVRSLGWMTFGECTALTTVTIGVNVDWIDYRAFEGCSKISAAYFLDTTTWSYDNPNDYQGAWDIGASTVANASKMAGYLRYDLTKR